MKYIVLLDSSNTSLTVGIATEDKYLETISFEAWQCQSEYMIPTLEKLLVKYNVAYNDISKVIVAVGPGSYTGVRISLTIAKTIALSSNCDVYPVSSLRVQKDSKNPSICVINARSGRSYFGVYEGNDIIINDCILKNDEVLEYISNHLNYVVCGNADYLGIEGYISDLGLQMFLLKSTLTKSENPLFVKPIYMKD